MTLFPTKGKTKTEMIAKLAVQAALDRGINHIVIASCTGESARYFESLKLNRVVVTRAYGFAGKGKNKMTEETRQKLVSQGFKVCTATHVLSGAERGLSKKFGGINPVEIMAHTLRMFGQGLKVAVECAVMALDAGLIPYGEKIIALGGTEEGLDTCIILSPEHANAILDSRIHEIICKLE